MMIKNIKHSQTIQPQMGGLAYWSVSANPMFSNDRGAEIRSRVREGWDG